MGVLSLPEKDKRNNNPKRLGNSKGHAFACPFYYAKRKVSNESMGNNSNSNGR